MIIPVSSNYISGAYTVLEVVLAAVLARLLVSIAGALNVKAIYDDRRKISLTASKIPAISDPGLTIPHIHFVTALLSVIVTLLMTVGQFGIVGVAKEEYEEVTVKYLVNKAPTGYVLNVQDHISMERKMVSKELVLLRQTSDCLRVTMLSSERYAYIYDGDDVEQVVHVPDSRLDITCVTNKFGFEKKVAHLHTENVSWISTITETIQSAQCEFIVNESDIALGKVTKVSVETNCPWTAKEAWCYKESHLYCAALWEHSRYYFIVLRVERDWEVGYYYTWLLDGEEFGTEKLKASALLLAVRPSIGTTSLKYMLSSRVERNATVRKIINPSRQATEIHVPLLSATLVPSVIILLLTTCTALYLWRTVIFIPGRQGYNRFNSAADLLSCAAVEKFRDGGCRYLRSGGISVGLDECGEYASPVKSDVGHSEGKSRRHVTSVNSDSFESGEPVA